MMMGTVGISISTMSDTYLLTILSTVMILVVNVGYSMSHCISDPDVSLAAKYPSLSMMRIKQLSGIKTPLGLDTVKRKTKPKS